jgi:hypothetical protein
MTVKDLKNILSTLPDDMDVFMAERKTEFTYGLLNSAKVKEIYFSEEPEDEPECYTDVLVLDEE